MTAEILVRYFHFIAIFILFSLLTVQHLLLKGAVEPSTFKRIRIIDMAYGITVFIVLCAGLGLLFWVGKPAGFYTHNWIFHTKVTLFALTAFLSIIPTVFILKNRKTTVAITVPKSILMVVRMELLLLCIIPLLAVLMANGVGYTQ
jgi:putative membrane protein